MLVAGVRPRPEVVAVAAGWASHLLLDTLGIALNGRRENWVLVLWPVLVKPNPLGLPSLAFLPEYVPSPSLAVELVIWLGVAYLLFAGAFPVPGQFFSGRALDIQPMTEHQPTERHPFRVYATTAAASGWKR